MPLFFQLSAKDKKQISIVNRAMPYQRKKKKKNSLITTSNSFFYLLFHPPHPSSQARVGEREGECVDDIVHGLGLCVRVLVGVAQLDPFLLLLPVPTHTLWCVCIWAYTFEIIPPSALSARTLDLGPFPPKNALSLSLSSPLRPSCDCVSGREGVSRLPYLDHMSQARRPTISNQSSRERKKKHFYLFTSIAKNKHPS